MRDAIEKELAFSADMIAAGHEVVPRFRIEVPGSDGYMLFVPLPEEAAERAWRLSLVSGFMAWKGAGAFVMSSEVTEPDAAVACAVWRGAGSAISVLAGLRLISRQPRLLGPVQWLPRDAIGDEFPALLPERRVSLSPVMIADLERVLGPQGAFKVERVRG